MSRLSRCVRRAGSANRLASRTAVANAFGVGNGAVATAASASPFTNQTDSPRASASSATACFGSLRRSDRNPSAPWSSEGGLVNTRQLSIWWRRLKIDQASSRSSGSLMARSNGSRRRRWPMERSCRTASSVSARRRRECRNRSDSFPLPGVVPRQTAQYPVAVGQTARQVERHFDAVRMGPGTIRCQLRLPRRVRQPPASSPPVSPTARAWAMPRIDLSMHPATRRAILARWNG